VMELAFVEPAWETPVLRPGVLLKVV
jgi:hypothetical protein